MAARFLDLEESQAAQDLAPARLCYYRAIDAVMDLLRSKGLRMTPQRRAIVAQVMRAHGHISPASLARTIQEEMPGVNASTVYRTLSLLEEVGLLQHSHLESGAEYHKREEAEHVHLTCGRCGSDEALSLPEAEALARLIRGSHGFVADLTHFAITGLCRSCAGSNGKRRTGRASSA